MSVSQQYALDLYRAARHGTTPPPAPGTADQRTLRQLREVRAQNQPRGSTGDGPLRRALRALLPQRTAVRRSDDQGPRRC